jgi:TonB family protein
MRANRLRGQVTIDFVVDENGHVQDPIVSQSSNPAFDSPALEALQKWTFKPATRAGKPVKAKMRVPILFALERDGVLEGEDLYRVEAEDMSKLPPEYQFDTAPKPRGTVAAVYPYELLREHVSGKAKVVCLIDARGKVVQVNVTSASKPEFGQALAAAFESFEFDPALNKGKPTATLLAMEKEFLLSTNNPFAAVVPTSVDFELLALEKKSPEKIRKLTELDAPLKPISRRSPVFPRAVAESVRTGEALVEFLIDEEGKARLPRIVSASEPAFGYAAAQAVSQWQFEPPKCAGKTVVVRARIPLKFDGGAAPAAKVAASEKPSEPAQ